MARGKMNEEVLALSRASKHIEELEDPRAQARVVTYLYLRYTNAGEGILTQEDREQYQPPVKPDPRQLMIPEAVRPIVAQPPSAPAGTAAAAPTSVPVASTATTTPVASPPAPTAPAASGGTPPVADLIKGSDGVFQMETGPGWDISGKGSEHDDDPDPALARQPKPHKPKAKSDGKGGWTLGEGDDDAEIEVKI